MTDLPTTPQRNGFRARVCKDVRAYARHEGAVLSATFVARMFLVTHGFQFVFARRLQDWMATIPVIGRPMRRVFWWWTCRSFSAELAIGATIEGGLYIPHPFGIVVGVCAIGRDVVILQNVTIGAKGAVDGPGLATIGDGAYLSAGAAVIGTISVGAGAVIGANAVVTRDVPAGAVAVGVPARIVGQTLS